MDVVKTVEAMEAVRPGLLIPTRVRASTVYHV